jgi:hypothetical protein
MMAERIAYGQLAHAGNGTKKASTAQAMPMAAHITVIDHSRSEPARSRAFQLACSTAARSTTKVIERDMSNFSKKPSKAGSDGIQAAVNRRDEALLRGHEAQRASEAWRATDVIGMVDAVNDRHFQEVERTYPVQAGNVDAILAWIGSALMMRVDATA